MEPSLIVLGLVVVVVICLWNREEQRRAEVSGADEVYVAAIRKEYSWVPADDYAAGRAELERLTSVPDWARRAGGSDLQR